MVHDYANGPVVHQSASGGEIGTVVKRSRWSQMKNEEGGTE